MEICQLRHQDIRQVEGVWIFDIQTVDEVHRVKAPLASVRLVPVHSQLLALGFLDWVKVQPEERVFPSMYQKGSPAAVDVVHEDAEGVGPQASCCLSTLVPPYAYSQASSGTHVPTASTAVVGAQPRQRR